MLEINNDSYVSIEYADQYVNDNYPEYDDLAVVWGVLTERDKEAYLRASAWQIETLVLQGVPLYKDQPMQFPRKECFREATYTNPTVPDEVKDAQVENAIALLNKDLNTRSDDQMKILGTLGAMKNIKYNKREMGEVGLGSSLTGTERKSRLESVEAEKMLKPWL